jgi:hypothetical protein
MRYLQSKYDFKDPLQPHYFYFREAGDEIDLLRSAFMRYYHHSLHIRAKTKKHGERNIRKGSLQMRSQTLWINWPVSSSLSQAGFFLVVPMIIIDYCAITGEKPSDSFSCCHALCANTFFWCPSVEKVSLDFRILVEVYDIGIVSLWVSMYQPLQ